MKEKKQISNGIVIINNDEYNPDFYYLLIMEWLYPTESGRDIHCETFDTKAEGLEKAREYCRIESIFVKRHSHRDMENLNFTWGPYADFGFTREDNPDKIGYMIVWDNAPSYYFKTKIIKMKLDKDIPIGKGMYNKDEDIIAAGRCANCTHSEECCYGGKKCEEC